MDANIINFILMGGYTLAAIAWCIQGNYPQMLYWVGAFILTLGITPATAQWIDSVGK